MTAEYHDYDVEIVDNPNVPDEKWLIINTLPNVKGGDFYGVKLSPCNEEMIDAFYNRKYEDE